MRTTLYIALMFSVTHLSAQFGIKLNTNTALESYTLFSNDDGTFLIDNCGDLINSWTLLRQRGLDNHAKLLESGQLYYISTNSVREMDWNGNITKELYHGISNLMLEYEAIKLENGNYLCLARYIEDFDFFSDLGYNFNLVFPEYDDAVVEMDGETGEVVWEWRISDHIIQERDPSLANYGILADNPGKLNLDAISTLDWQFEETFMLNGMDYNPELDQIALSVRKIGEVIIIDHSTTTEEAASHEGGLYGNGGDALYRWGNPQNYDRGTSADRILYFQHNPNWILYGDYKGQLMIYNNLLGDPNQDFDNQYSEVVIVDPVIDADGNYPLADDEAFQPVEPERTYSGEDLDFFSDYTSGAVVMPNGNFHVTEGRPGILKEYTSDGELVWQYNIPDANYIFRAEKYPIDFPGFDNQDLTPNGLVPFAEEEECQLSAVNEAIETININFVQTDDRLEIYSRDLAFHYELYNMSGQLIKSNNRAEAQRYFLELNILPAGIYTLRTFNQSFSTTKSIFVK